MNNTNYAQGVPDKCERCGKEFSDKGYKNIPWRIGSLGAFCKSCRDKIEEFAKNENTNT